MYITNITDTFNDTFSINNNCTNNDNNFEIIIPFVYDNPMWIVTYMFNIPYGVYFIQNFTQ